MSGPQSLKDFAGPWRLTRQIDDHASGQVGTFNGAARFNADHDALLYEEDGTLSLGAGASMRATRRYIWREGPSGIEVLFEDGRAFHGFSLGQGKPDASHFCAPDTYNVTYDFSDWPTWSSAWNVSGPRKDYTVRSHYVRTDI